MKSGILMLAAVASCAASANAELIFGVTNTQTLVRWDRSAPSTILGGAAISGLMANEVVRSIDFRPSNGKLYAIGSFGNIYTLNLNTGVASFVSQISTPLNGSSFGVDFNPVVDRLRVITDADQNLRINVDTGAAIVDGPLAYVAGDPNFGRNANAVHAAYTNSFAGATSTPLFVLDTGLDILAIQNPPNAGGLMSRGAIGANLTDVGAFDISGTTGRAYVTVLDTARSQSTFWSLDLSTGAGTFLGDMGMIGGGTVITAMSVMVPAPGSALLLALGGAAVVRRRR